jgi:hypothetical protein
MIEMGISPEEEVAYTFLKTVQSKPPLPRYLVGNDAAMITGNRKSMTDIEFEKFLNVIVCFSSKMDCYRKPFSLSLPRIAA